MNGALLRDAFDHHVWATIRLIDVCLPLSAEQLGASVPGIYGSILDTMRHTVSSDASYLHVLTNGALAEIDDSAMDLGELRAVMEADGEGWRKLLDQDLDPNAMATRHRDDGIDSHVPVTIRLAQALHHGTDHRSQICTILTSLGVEPPEIDVADFARAHGRVSETRRQA
jgi:uncharacterized damage-inducible protein DinB